MFCFPLYCFFLSSFISGSPISRFIGHRGSLVVSIILSGLGMLSSILIEYEVIYGGCEAQMNYFGSWISLGSFDISWSSYTDIYSAHMLLTVSVVSFAVHCYAAVYMKSDPHLTLFMCYLSAFTFSMLILVSGSNMLIMMLGWELIGVCSYLLIGYWSHRLAASKSAQKAIVVNRISDGLLLWSIIWLWWYCGILEYDLILLNDSNNISSILSISLLLGCMAKSVQIIFHVWLADSMEGPTPVSALIHAATLVTAGIYVMVRISIFDNTLVLLVGSLTALMGGNPKNASYYGNIIMNTLLDAGKSFLGVLYYNTQYVWNYFMNNTINIFYFDYIFNRLFQNKVKIFHLIAQSAGLLYCRFNASIFMYECLRKAKTLLYVARRLRSSSREMNSARRPRHGSLVPDLCQAHGPLVPVKGQGLGVLDKSAGTSYSSSFVYGTYAYCLLYDAYAFNRSYSAYTIFSQRLNARDHMWLVGFVEGDGYFGVTRNGKYVKYVFSIDLQISDIQLLYKIKDILGGNGVILTKKCNKVARFYISSKIILRTVILPIFDKYSTTLYERSLRAS